MAAFAFILFGLIVPLFAAPTNNQKGQGSDQGPPPECEKPFGDGKLAQGPSQYNFTVIARQRSDAVDYKKTFKGAPIDMIITFTAGANAGPVQAFALRAGIPFPVVQWQNTGDKQAKIVSCIAPQSVDTVLVKGQIGQRYSVAAVPLLAAWANRKSLPVVYEMAIQGSDGHIFVSAFNGTIDVQETDYELPAQFFQPPPNMRNGQVNMTDPRMQMQRGPSGMQGMGMQPGRQQRDALNTQAVFDDEDEQEMGN